MDYIPVKTTENHNVSKKHPLMEFSWLIATAVVLVVVCYFFLGIVTEGLVRFAPNRLESVISPLVNIPLVDSDEYESLQAKLDSLVKDLAGHHEFFSTNNYSVGIIESEAPNAFALPGKRLLVTTALVEQSESEEELAMVLGHELGHIVNRDPLRALARRLGFTVISAFIFGSDGGGAISNISNLAELSFSRTQETKADTIGLSLLESAYGHCGGATKFFEKLLEEDSLSEAPEFLSTHPDTEKRIKKIKSDIQEADCPISELRPLKY